MSNYQREVIVIANIIKAVVAIIGIFAFYVQFHGELSPGGGFQGGIILSMFFILPDLIRLCATPGELSRSIVFGNNFSMLCGIIGIFIYIGSGLLFKDYIFDYLGFTIFGLPPNSMQYGLFVSELGIGISIFGSMCMIYKSFSTLIEMKQ